MFKFILVGKKGKLTIYKDNTMLGELHFDITTRSGRLSTLVGLQEYTKMEGFKESLKLFIKSL